MRDQRRQFVLGFLAYAIQRDIDATDLCQEARIDLGSLQFDPGVEISEQQIQRLWSAGERLAKDPLFGLHLGESFQLAALGAVGEIIKSSQTVGQALTVASSFTPVITTLYTMTVERDARNVSVVFSPTREEPREVARQIADFLMVFTVHELGGLLLTKVVPTFIHYPFPIVNGSEYERVFRRSPMARHKQLKISFDATIWDEPVITANYEVQRFFLERVGASAHANRPASFHTKITEYLLKNAYHGIPSLEEVSGNFNMTPRSLQRRLREEGTTFQQAIDSARKTLALHYLSSGHYRVKEISSLLGYNEISAFSRAFKRWTGKAPMTYSA